MKETIIRVSNLSKKYSLGKAVKGDLRSTISNIFSKKKKSTADNDFWALKDISFEVKIGEVLGIIGGNGAGKSTLLKILSRITVPTTGSVEIMGRVASLLEVGTGFHPELTGRENIFLNGSLLGMKKKEIIARFDEIVAFSGVEKFIDTPVKHYSSGMYVRLAFAVAAHLEPEILIVDEVLAVGDMAFQKKCLDKMGEVANGGKTVIFVSHNLNAIESLCSKGIFLEQGKLVEADLIHKVIHRYLNAMSECVKLNFSERKDRGGQGVLKLMKGFVADENEKEVNLVSSGQRIKIILLYESACENFEDVIVKFECKDQFGRYMFLCNNRISQGNFKSIPGKGRFICTIPRLILNEGIYTLDLFVKVNGKDEDIILNAMELKVAPGRFYQTGLLPGNKGVLLDYNWEFLQA